MTILDYVVLVVGLFFLAAGLETLIFWLNKNEPRKHLGMLFASLFCFLLAIIFVAAGLKGSFSTPKTATAPVARATIALPTLVPTVPKEVPAAQVCPTVPVPTCATPAPAFGPEMAFPAQVSGPAIAELWNPNSGFCALVKINAGESLDWKFSGAWWQADSQAELDVRWPHHAAEYLAKPSNAKCTVLNSSSQVP